MTAWSPSGRRLGDLIGRLRASGGLTQTMPAIRGLDGRRSLTALDETTPVAGVAYDSRRAGPGSVFVAIRGAHSDGHDHVLAAAHGGAVAAIVEFPVHDSPVPQIVVRDSRQALAVAAAWWFGDPSRSLGIVGITGTDGKTSTTFLVASVLETAGISTGLITTAAVKIGRIRAANAEHVTTPEAPELQATLREMVEAGNRAALVETTSHGLALHRVDEIAYDLGIFTNLSHEHLELHGTFEAYRDAKLSLFRRLGGHGSSEADAGAGEGGAGGEARPEKSIGWPATAIVNLDDPSAGLFVRAARDSGAGVITYGESPEANVRAMEVVESEAGLRVKVVTPRWRGPLTIHLRGRFNCLNALAAVSLGEAIGLDPEAIRAGIAAVSAVPGRMERVDCGQPFEVIVDYAHSPAALRTVLDSLGPGVAARGGGVIAVFGSAGERDVAKRELMGRIAGERCRAVFVTDEDPRGEDPLAIIDEIARGAEAVGMTRGRELRCILDRREAILAALRLAGPHDLVLLAGKGHEQTIIMRTGPIAWDERAEAIAGLARLGYGGTAGDAGHRDEVEENGA